MKKDDLVTTLGPALALATALLALTVTAGCNSTPQPVAAGPAISVPAPGAQGAAGGAGPTMTLVKLAPAR